MTDLAKQDTQDYHKELIAKAKELGIKSPHVCKPETLEKKIAAILEKPTEGEPPKLDVQLGDFGKRYLDSIKFDVDWLLSIANQYHIEKFEYMHKFRAFRAYRKGVHVDWITVNDIALLNGKRELCEIMLKHTPVGKQRAVFNFHWRPEL